MTDSVRERLMAAILTRVGGQYGLPEALDERELPATVVDDGRDSVVQATGVTRLTMNVTICRAEPAVSTNPDAMRVQAHAALASLIVAMHADETFGGLAKGVEYLECAIAMDARRIVFAEAVFSVSYEHERGNPAALPTY